jgi:hypothetical protein
MCGAGLGFSFFGLRFSRLPRCSLLAMVISIECALGQHDSTSATERGATEGLPAGDFAVKPSIGVPLFLSSARPRAHAGHPTGPRSADPRRLQALRVADCRTTGRRERAYRAGQRNRRPAPASVRRAQHDTGARPCTWGAIAGSLSSGPRDSTGPATGRINPHGASKPYDVGWCLIGCFRERTPANLRIDS